MSRPILTNANARRLFLHLHGLATRPASLAGLFRDLAFVQLDSINTVARAHHMIIHARLPSYRPGDLDRLLKDRLVFEHWTHDASIIHMDFYPHWQLRFRRAEVRLRDGWGNSDRAGFVDKLPEVLARIEAEGPVSSSEVGEDEERSSGGWWDWPPSKTALEFLWHSGRIAVSHRQGFRKYYDLAERVIPEPHRAIRPEPAETVDWACNAAVDRLGFATSGEVYRFFNKVTATEARDWCRAEHAAGRLIEVDVEAADGSLRRALGRPDILEAAAMAPPPPGLIRILSPFDPVLRDRARTERLFGFFYRIEIFVPAEKRQYGYYILPVLEGDRLIGRIDMKADDGTLAVTRFWPEPGTAMGKGRLARLDAALTRTARLAAAVNIEKSPGWLAV